MSDVTAKFGADFSDFTKGADDSKTKMRELEGAAGSAGASLRRIGGSEAATSFAGLRTVAGETTNTFRQLEQGLATADKTLGLLGVHIGPEIHALGELGDVVGKTASQIGTIGTATSIAAAAFAGWNIGRKISELAGLDEAIGNTVAKFLELGDVQAQTAGARQDVLDRASALAKRTVTDFTEAQQIIAKSLRDLNAEFDTNQHRVAEWQAEIRKARADGRLDELTDVMKMGTATVAEMSREFKLSEGAINLWSKQVDAAADAAKKLEDANKRLNEQQQQFNDAQNKRVQDLIGSNNDLAAAVQMLEDIEQRGVNVANLRAESQAKVADTMNAGIRAAYELNQADSPLVDQFFKLAVAASESKLALDAEAQAKRANAAAAAAATAEQQRLNQAMIDAYKASGGTNVGGFESGYVPIGASAMRPSVGLAPSVFAAGGVAGVNTPGTVLSPAAVGGAPVVNQTFNVNGTGQDVARIAMSEMSRVLSVGTQWAVTQTGR